MTRPPPAQLIAGDPRHGVVRFAHQLAGAVAAASGHPTATATPPGRGPVHLHFTDRLWGRDPAAAADAIAALAEHHRVTVTLHDVPQASDGTARLPARRACYRSVLRASAGAVCNSEHERTLLGEAGIVDPQREPAVIPLPIIPVPGISTGPTEVIDEVALLGFVYPGKGHAEAIDAIAELAGPRPRVRALGAVSPGHAAELAQLSELARRRGVDFSATGWLEEEELHRRLRAARVPLAAHRHISASGSINSWVAAGRVPLVADSRYARELERLRPGTIRRYPPGQLTAAIGATLTGDDAATHQPLGLNTRPHLDDVAARYLEWWAT